jgi:hypothetical protein
LAQSPIESALKQAARASILQGVQAVDPHDEEAVTNLALAVSLEPGKHAIPWEGLKRAFRSSWNNLLLLSPILVPGLWPRSDWQELQNILRVGGHEGKSASWLLERNKLTVGALNDDRCRETIFDDSQNGLGFLRHAIVDGLAGGDGVLQTSQHTR